MRFVLALVLAAFPTAAYAGDLIPTDARYGPLRVALHKVDTTIDNQVALTRVEQVFANDHGVQLEGQYTFPVPKGATIIDFSMTINGKLMRAELLEKDRARSIYEGIVRQARDPGLLEHVGSNLFRIRVFPILPRSEQKIEITYVERLTYDNGTCRFVYPLMTPGARGTTKADRFEFRWRLASRVPIKDVACPTHRANITRRVEEAAEVTFEGRDVDLLKDLEITYRIARAQSGMDLVAHRPKDGDGTFMLLLTPQADAPILPKDMTFVFDTSGSMEGRRIRQAKAALKFCLLKLQPEDRFNILTFSDEVASFEPRHGHATDDAKVRAFKFIDAIEATGSTNISGALLKAMEHQPRDHRPHLILFLTDGHPTAGQTDPRQIVRSVLAANRANVRIFSFGVGDNLNKDLLEDLSEATRAVAEFVSESQDIEEKVSRLQKKVAAPVISELSIDWGQAEVSHVYPKALGDLYAGTQLMVTGRYLKAGEHEVALRGRLGPKEIVLKRTVTFPERADASPGLPYLWAMRKIAHLIDDQRRNGENAEVVQEIVGLSKEYRIATPYTSFLALETEADYARHGVERRSRDAAPPAPATASGDALFRKAEYADHAETADEEDFQKAREQSLDFVSDRPFRGRGTYDTIGGGAGGGGRFGSRLGGKKNLVLLGGGDAGSEVSVLAALRWLARHQNKDGSWGVTTYVKRCTPGADKTCKVNPGDDEHQVGVTGLSLLAFLGAGYSHLSKDTYDGICFGDVVRAGLQYLLQQQDGEGCIGKGAPKFMYSHAIAALALAEAYGITGSNLIKDEAQKAVDYLIAAQNPGKGWRYGAKCGDNDTSVTAWATMALKSAEMAGLAFPRRGYDGARAWWDEATDENHRTGYNQAGTGKVFIPGVSEGFDHHETMTAASVMGRIFVDRDKADKRLAAGVDLLLKDLPAWEPTKIDACYWFFASAAIFQFDGPGGPKWKAWNEPLKEALLKNQNRADHGCMFGSWEPSDRWSSEGGRVYVTALNALTLEVYYRYPNVFGGK